MKLPAALEKSFARFDQLSLRERALLAGAVLIGIVMIWDTALMKPLRSHEQALVQELQTLQGTSASLASAEGSQAPDATAEALAREQAVQRALERANSELATASAGMIAPDRMVEVVQDVLGRQRGLRLVLLRNKPVVSLLEPAASEAGESTPASVGPYIHPIELTVEGQYLDILKYLEELEALPWQLQWSMLELNTVEYPVNRVRIELSTVSMEKAWLGV